MEAVSLKRVYDYELARSDLVSPAWIDDEAKGAELGSNSR